MKFRITLGTWETQRIAARAVRHEVFVIEQRVPLNLEWDETDALCMHAVAHDEAGRPIGTGRLLPDGHIGRMAVLKSARGEGIGAAILVALMEQAGIRGDRALALNAQVQAEPFYVRHGFVREGNEFIEAGISHIRMRKEIQPKNGG